MQGHIDVLRWAHENGCPLDNGCLPFAAQGGHLATVQWLRANGCPWSLAVCNAAVIGQQGRPGEPRAWSGEVKDVKGHVHVLRWVRKNGCPWDAGTKATAWKAYKYRDTFGNVVRPEDEGEGVMMTPAQAAELGLPPV